MSTDEINGQLLYVQHGEGCPISAIQVFRAPHHLPRFDGRACLRTACDVVDVVDLSVLCTSLVCCVRQLLLHL